MSHKPTRLLPMAWAGFHTCICPTLTVLFDHHMSKLCLSIRLLLAEKLVTAPSDATSEVARAVSATERAIRKELELSRISVASSGVGDQQEADPEYQCPICLVASLPLHQPLHPLILKQNPLWTDLAEWGLKACVIILSNRVSCQMGPSQVCWVLVSCPLSWGAGLSGCSAAGGDVPAAGPGVRAQVLRGLRVHLRRQGPRPGHREGHPGPRARRLSLPRVPHARSSSASSSASVPTDCTSASQ